MPSHRRDPFGLRPNNSGSTFLVNEMPTNLNARRIARLGAGRIEAFNRVFRARRDVLDWFGYDLMAANRALR